MKRVDLAYYAGILDGEGSIQLFPNRCKTFWLGISVVNTDEWIVQSLKFAFGGQIGFDSRGHNQKPIFRWRITSKGALSFLEQVYPYLKLKKPHADIAIAFQKHKSRIGSQNNPEYKLWEEERKIAITKLNQRGRISV